MLCVTVELLDGMIAAGAPDDIALTGSEDEGEWPPSPARLLAALVAADGTGQRCRVTDGSELAVLEAAGPPVVIADPRRDVAVTPQVPRYVPEDRHARGAVQEYVARKATLVRPAPRLAPRTPTVVYAWEHLEIDPETFEALRLRAARVGYLGTAACSARVTVHSRAPEGALADSTRRWEPDTAGSVDLPVPFDGLVKVLDRMHEGFSDGEPVRRSWYPSERASYRAPDERAASHAPDVDVVWLRLHGSLSGRHVLRLTQALRGAVLNAYEQHVARSAEDVPAVLHGHGLSGPDYEHVAWLALPDVGHRYATGRIHGAAIVLPADTDAGIREGVRTAVRAVGELHLPGGTAIEVSPSAGEARPLAALPRRWTRPAERWQSAFPVVHERFVRPQPDLNEIARWCTHAGFPPPVDARLCRVPMATGAVSLMPHEAKRSHDERRPYSHLELQFADPVRGPMALGHMRHFGVGLMMPATQQRQGEQSDRVEADGG